MSTSFPEDRKWPLRLSRVSREIRNPQDASSRDQAYWEGWRLLYLGLSLYLRSHASRMGGLSREDIEDLAAEKSSGLLRRIVSGETDFSRRSPPEIVRFLSKVAKNGLLDLIRREGRLVQLAEGDRPQGPAVGPTGGRPSGTAAPPDLLVEQKEFARALRRCAERLDPRSRCVWVLRVLYELSSKEIAVHPRVGLKVNHVDVLLHHSRKAIRRCMQRQGHQPQEIPPGTFTELWKVFHPEAGHESGE